MYQKVLVPLDGSELAECVLPHVRNLAAGGGAREIILVRVVEPFIPPATGEYTFSGEDLTRIETESRAEAVSYLNNVTERLKKDGVSVQAKVLYGRAAESLADLANKNDVDLIVIATHGRSGVSRWIWGSVTDRVLRSACAPILTVRSPGCGVLCAPAR